MKFRIALDVANLEEAILFYTGVFGFSLGRRFDDDWVELVDGPIPVDLLRKPSGTRATPSSPNARNYQRHWTPLHLDFIVQDIEAAVRRAEKAGARLEGAIQEHAYGRLALMGDPFGHGFCFLEFRGKGYGELEGAPLNQTP